MRVRATLSAFSIMIVAAAHLGCATSVAGGCASDADCAAGEICDAASNRCFPGGASGGDGGATTDGGVTDALSHDGTPAGDAPNDTAADEAPPGCDLDGDGVQGAQCGGGDCDESDAAVHPGATELCNEADEDCDDIVDEGCDDDGDGFCDARQDPDHCDDCCDATALAKPGQVQYFNVPTDCDDFDYDCDGTEEMAVTATSGTCSCSSGSCSGNPIVWWVGTPPACGAMGYFEICSGACPCPNWDVGTQACR